MIRISKDLGRTWSEPIVVQTLHRDKGEGFLFCRWVTRLHDNSLLLATDRVTYKPFPPGAPHNWFYDPRNDSGNEAWLYRSVDDGRTWTGPEKTHRMTVSVSVRQVTDGTIFMMGEHYDAKLDYWRQVAFLSTDNGKTWSDPITMFDDRHCCTGEGDLVEMPGGKLVAYMRANKIRVGAIKAVSDDGGRTWSGPFAAGKYPINGRVTAGRLSSGEVLVVHRVYGDNFGFFVESEEAASARVPYDAATYKSPALNWGIIDIEHNKPRPDGGYGGWVELPDGDVYAVSYITDDAPKPQIRGYRLSRKVLLTPHPKDTRTE
jgi:hypothetical protein